MRRRILKHLCTSADLDVVSYGANVKLVDVAVQSILEGALFRPLMTTANRTALKFYFELNVFRTCGSPVPPI